MTHRPFSLTALAAALALAAGSAPAPLAAGPAVPVAAAVGPASATPVHPEMPVRQAYAYRMMGRIRPLLFWIGRDNVGTGLIVWRNGEGTTAYELLIGTDPATAPRGLNRWGYIVEDVGVDTARVFGLMTTSEEATLSEVSGKLGQGQARGKFKAIDARIEAGAVHSSTGTIETERDLTLHEVSDLVQKVRDRLTSVTPRDGAVPAGVRPGFLTAVAELMADTITARRSGKSALGQLKGRRIAYVYGRNLLDLTLTGVETSSPGDLPATPVAQAPLHAEFEARSRVDGERYHFELDYGSEGPMAGVPLVIRYQPRWWLQVQLTLDADGARMASLQRTGAMKTAWENAVR